MPDERIRLEHHLVKQLLVQPVRHPVHSDEERQSPGVLIEHDGKRLPIETHAPRGRSKEHVVQVKGAVDWKHSFHFSEQRLHVAQAAIPARIVVGKQMICSSVNVGWEGRGVGQQGLYITEFLRHIRTTKKRNVRNPESRWDETG